MTSWKMRGVGLALVAGGIAIAPAAPASAQAVTPFREDAGTALPRHLRTLADNPRSLAALMGAGTAALQLGDAQGALTFFGRAEELAPRDGRIKMWLGAALVQLEQPRAALRFFEEALRMSASPSDVAKERGLAYDLLGDQARAQADYRLALQRIADPELTRRLALSLAISGDKDGALALLDEQTRRHDRAGWRARALVMAIAGDLPEAQRSAQAAMPGPAASAMTSFFTRLPALRGGDQARAVHFGHIPPGTQPVQVAANTSPPAPAQAAPTEARNQRRTQSRQPAASTNRDRTRTSSRSPEPRTRGGRRSVGRLVPVDAPAPRRETAARQTAPAPVQPQPAPPPAEQPRQAAPTPTTASASTATRPAAPVAEPARVAEPSRPAPTPVEGQPAPAVTGEQRPAVQTPAQATTPPRPAPAEPVALQPVRVAEPAPPGPGFESVIATVEALPEEAPPASSVSAARTPAPPAVTRPAEPRTQPAPAPPARRTATTTPAERPAARPGAAAARHPSRHWVQIAGGADVAALPREFTRLKQLAPALLGDRNAWTTPLRFTNRLLVGPFRSLGEAQAFVNQLAEKEIAAFAWTSPAGQEIARLPAR